MAPLRIIFVLTFLALVKKSWAATNHVYMYPTWCGAMLDVTAAKVVWPATNYRDQANLYGTGYDCTVVARAEYLNQTVNLYANLALSQPTAPAGAVTTSPLTTMTPENVTVTTQVANATNSTATATSGNLATSTNNVATSISVTATASTVTNLAASVTSGNDITTSCDTDYLAIYDGPSTSASLIEKLCYGNTLLDTANQDSSGPYVTFRFVRSGKYLYNFTLWYTSFHTGSCEDRSTWLECASGRCIKFHLTCDSANNCGRGDDTDQSNNAPASCSEEDPVASTPDYTPIWVSLGLLGGLCASFVAYWCCWRPGWGPWRCAVLRQLGCCRKNAGSGEKTGTNSGRDGSADGKRDDYEDDEESGLGAEGPEQASGGLLSCFGGSQPRSPGKNGKVGHAGQAGGGRGDGSPKTGWGQRGERPPSRDGDDDDFGDDYYRMDDVFYADVCDIDDYAGGHAREAR
ncbi:uncharacterized protein LOC144920246 isoform X2 [Branchiostoma floridae x Branchiostoma belcheri]